MSSEEYPNINLKDVLVTQLFRSKRSGWSLDVIVGISVVHLPTNVSAVSTTFENAHKDRHVALKELDRKVGLLMNDKQPGIILSTPKIEPVPFAKLLAIQCQMYGLVAETEQFKIEGRGEHDFITLKVKFDMLADQIKQLTGE